MLEKYNKLKYYYKRRKGECVGKKERDGERREEGGEKEETKTCHVVSSWISFYKFP